MAPVIVVGRQGNTSRSLDASSKGRKRSLRHWLDRLRWVGDGCPRACRRDPDPERSQRGKGCLAGVKGAQCLYATLARIPQEGLHVDCIQLKVYVR